MYSVCDRKRKEVSIALDILPVLISDFKALDESQSHPVLLHHQMKASNLKLFPLPPIPCPKLSYLPQPKQGGIT